MIHTQIASLRALEHVAHSICGDEVELYAEMTGREFVPDEIASTLHLSGGRAWQFWDMVEREPVACGGYTLVRPGTWASWFMSTPRAWKKGGNITECVAKCVQSMLDDPEVLRLETTTLATRTRAHAWYERIGLHYESTACKASASGQDLVTYVALRAA